MKALFYKGEDIVLTFTSVTDMSAYTKVVKFFTPFSAVKTATVTAVNGTTFTAKLAKTDTADLKAGRLNIVLEFTDGSSNKTISKTINCKLADAYIDGEEREGANESDSEVVFLQNNQISVHITGAEFASDSAENAALSLTYKNAAESANTSAQSAKTAAETANTNAQTAKTAAETAKTAAETARDTAVAATVNKLDKSAVKTTLGTSSTDVMSQKAVTDELKRVSVFTNNAYANSLIQELYFDFQKEEGYTYYLSWLNYSGGLITTLKITKKDASNNVTNVLLVNNISASSNFYYKFSGGYILINLNAYESAINTDIQLNDNVFNYNFSPIIKSTLQEESIRIKSEQIVVVTADKYANSIFKEIYLNVTKNAGDVFYISWLNYANGIITTFTIKKKDINNTETTVLSISNATASGLYLHRFSNGSTVLFNLNAYVSAINTAVNLNDNIFVKSLSPLSNLQLNTNINDELNYKSIYNLGKNNILYSTPTDVDLSSIIEQGSFEYGAKTTSTTRIRTDFKEINFYSKYVISCATGYLFQMHILDSLKNVVSSSSFVNSLYADINGKYVIIVIKKSDDSSISVSDFASVSLAVKQYTGTMLPIPQNKRISENDYINKLFKGLYINKEAYDNTKRYYIQWFNYVGGVITTFNIYKSNYDGSNAALLVSGSGDTVSGITYIRKTGLVAIIDLNEFVSVVNYNVELNPCVFDKTTNSDIQNLIDGNVSVQLSNLMIDSGAATFGRILRQKLNDEVFIMPFISDIHAIENYASNYYYRSFSWLYAKFLSQLAVNFRCNAFAILGDTGIDEPTYLYKIMMEYASCVQLDIPFHFAIGNHEYVFTGTTGSVNDVAFYNAFRKYTCSKFNMNTSESTRYCEFYDDITTGIRIITINTYLGASVYIPFLVNALSTLSAGQIAVILQHEPPYVELSALPNVNTNYAEERTILSAFVAKQSGTTTNSTYDFTTNTGKLAVMICGHVHATIYDTISGVNIYASSGLGLFDASYVPVGKGRNEKLILGVHPFGEVLSINKTTNKAKIYRIGRNDIDGSVDVEFSF